MQIKILLLLFIFSLFIRAEVPSSENQKYIDEIIYSEIRTALFSTKEIEEKIIQTVEDNGFEKEFSKSWIKSRIKEEYQKLLAESKHWKSPTDVELLIKAFNELAKDGIIALHNAGYDTREGLDEVQEIIHKLKKKSIKRPIGYCFYHQQDLERAISATHSNLYLSFNTLKNISDKETIKLGQKIVKILKKYHFKINWDETANTKIEILNFKWQQLYNPSQNLTDYRQIIKILSK